MLRAASSPAVSGFEMIPPVLYVPHPDHRNGTALKSQWTISTADEHRCFDQARTAAWLDTTRGWGLHRPEGEPTYLGVGVDRRRRLFVAKFVRGREDEPWHGYPADTQRHPQDLPSYAVRRAWLDDGILSAVIIRRLSKGQPCAL